MKSWEHCAKTWFKTDSSLATENIKNNSIVKCKLNEEEYYFNIPDEKNKDITKDMIRYGKWYIYTFAL